MPFPDAPLSILVVTAMYPHPERPGSGSFVLHQVEELRALGHRVDVVHVKGYRSRWLYVRGMACVLYATWHTRYDIVHVHYGVTALSALLRWRAPMVITFHGSDVLQGWMVPLFSRVVSRLADATIVVSPEIAERCPGALIPCGVDLARFTPSDRTAARRRLGLDLQVTYVLFPFNPARRVKRHDLASAAVRLLRERGDDVSLLVVHDVANDQMPLYYAAANAMILCSDTEGSPTSVKEALACDLPVVSTDVGDVRSVMQGIPGTEMCRQDAASLADALRRTLDRGDLRSAGRVAMARFDQATTVRALVNVYSGVVRRRRPEPRCGTNAFEKAGR